MTGIAPAPPLTGWRYYLARARFVMRMGNSLPYRLATLAGLGYSPSLAIGGPRRG